VEAPIRATLRSYHSGFPVKLVAAHTALDQALWMRRIAARLLTVFGLLALALAAVGVYGITAHLVTRRTGEIGVRMAMGACPVDVMELVMRQCVTLILPALGLGAVASFVLARGFQKMLYGVSETDLESYLVTAILLAAVALIASYLPARRVTRLAPVMALRQE
jgi:putative ABC transport system permease protein